MSEHASAHNPDPAQGDQSAEQHDPEGAKIPEKLKAEKLEPKEGKEIKPEAKVEIKEKPEKFEKNEFKEHKPEGKVEIKEKPEKFEKIEFKEHKPEGKVEIKEKPEKFEKNELKEHKSEKFEKIEFKEHKPEGKIEIKEKPEKLEKPEKPEKLEFEGQPPSGPVPGPGPVQVDRETLLGYAAALEKAGQDLRHFIEQSERPDLTHGALRNEPDDQDESRADS